MDDKRLQTEFDEYFRGADLPANMTADAKAQVKPRKKGSLKLISWLAPVAAASVFVVAFALGFFVRFAILPTSPEYSYYSVAGLTTERIDPYSAGDIQGLEFAEELTNMPNASVREITTYSDGENMVLAKADIILLHNGYRHDTTIYAEYTDKYICYEELEEYLTGDSRYFGNYKYIYNTSYDEGENVYTVYLNTGKVKYYISVTTSEADGYTVYLDLLKNS